MTLSVGDIIRTSLNFQLPDGSQFQNVYHHIFDGIGGVSDAAVTADIRQWAEATYNTLIASVHGSVTPQLSAVDQVEFVVDQWEVVANIGSFVMTFVPTGAGDTVPNQIAPFVVFRTARPKSVGRKFMFQPLEAEQNAGIMVPTLVAKYVTFAGDVLDDIVLDVTNELHSGIPRTGVNDWLQFTIAIVNNLVGTQRRRRPGVGA